MDNETKAWAYIQVSTHRQVSYGDGLSVVHVDGADAVMFMFAWSRERRAWLSADRAKEIVLHPVTSARIEIIARAGGDGAHERAADSK